MPRSRTARDGRTIARTMARAQSNALQAARLTTASAAVISRRLALGQAAMQDPVGADHAEFVRMGAEKGTAAMEAAGAAWRQSPAIATSLARYGFTEMAAAWQAGMKVATAASPAGAAQAQVQYATQAFGRAVSLCLGLGAAGARMAGAMTAPVLRTAAANARRLG